jgi:hypothetical protein
MNFVAERSQAEELLATTPGLRGEVLDLDQAAALRREIFGSLLDTEEAI